jgi:hypothetical protein
VADARRIARLDRQDREVVVADRVASVQRQLVDDMEIRAPFTGIVVARRQRKMISPISAAATRAGICTSSTWNRSKSKWT